MKMEYKKEIHHSYLIAHLINKSEEYTYPWRMVTENHISGLLSCECRRIDNEILMYYEITSRISLKDVCKGRKITGKQVIWLFQCLFQLFHTMEEYLLPQEAVYLNMNYIYVDAEMSQAEFCYIPEEQWNLEQSLRELLEEILPALDTKEKNYTMAIYNIYQNIVSDECTIEYMEKQIYQILKEEQREELDVIEPEEIADSGKKERELLLDEFFSADDEEEDVFSKSTANTLIACVILYLLVGWYLIKNYPFWLIGWGAFGILAGIVLYVVWKKKDKKIVNKERKNKEDRGNSCWTTEENKEWERKDYVNMGESYTCILSKPEQIYYLEEVVKGERKRIEIGEQEIQLIGYLKEKTDIYIPSQMVSRIHARLRKEGDNCFLSDLNSKNGTWVNGKELEGKEEYLLKEGDQIQFADRIYQWIKI